MAKSKGATIVSIVNVETSTMYRYSDIVLPLKAGPEKAGLQQRLQLLKLQFSHYWHTQLQTNLMKADNKDYN